MEHVRRTAAAACAVAAALLLTGAGPAANQRCGHCGGIGPHHCRPTQPAAPPTPSAADRLLQESQASAARSAEFNRQQQERFRQMQAENQARGQQFQEQMRARGEANREYWDRWTKETTQRVNEGFERAREAKEARESERAERYRQYDERREAARQARSAYGDAAGAAAATEPPPPGGGGDNSYAPSAAAPAPTYEGTRGVDPFDPFGDGDVTAADRWRRETDLPVSQTREAGEWAAEELMKDVVTDRTIDAMKDQVAERLPPLGQPLSGALKGVEVLDYAVKAGAASVGADMVRRGHGKFDAADEAGRRGDHREAARLEAEGMSDLAKGVKVMNAGGPLHDAVAQRVDETMRMNDAMVAADHRAAAEANARLRAQNQAFVEAVTGRPVTDASGTRAAPPHRSAQPEQAYSAADRAAGQAFLGGLVQVLKNAADAPPAAGENTPRP